MPHTRGFAGVMIALPGLAGSAQLLAQARETTVVRYDCNLDGAPAQLVAQVETVRPAGVFMGSDGRFGGAIDSGEVNYYYQGTLSSASARYSFTGENQYADFVDMTNNERFRVQFVVQGQQMLMIVNPFGPGTVQYQCQQAGGSAQMGGNPPQPGAIPQPGPAGQAGGASGQRAPAPGAAGAGVDLDQLMQAERQDLGVQPTRELPGAVPAAWASQSGTLKDQVQQAFVQLLQQQTGGNKQMPLVFYCLSRECWMSYNAALRAIAAGYGNVLWYRGGLEAWKLAGLPTQPGQQGAASR